MTYRTSSKKWSQNTPVNISGVDRGKESEQGNVGIDVTIVITYKTPFVVNGELVTVSLDLG